MKQYTVTGMSCAACSARVEKAVSEVPGVTSCSVSLLTIPWVSREPRAPQEIIRRLRTPDTALPRRSGAARKPRERRRRAAGRDVKGPGDASFKKETGDFGRLSAVLMYFSMGTYGVGMAAAAFFEGNHGGEGLV